MDNKEVSHRFGELLSALGVTYFALAKKAKIKKVDTLYHLKAGKTKPSFETLSRIVIAFPQTNIYYLLGLEDNPIRVSSPPELMPVEEDKQLKNLHKMIYPKRRPLLTS